MSVIILTLSIILQFAAAILAIKRIQSTEKLFAWIAISTALFLMAIRRCITLSQAVIIDSNESIELITEITALFISIFMLIGVYLIGKIFESMNQMQEQLKDEKIKATENTQLIKQNEQAMHSLATIFSANSSQTLFDNVCQYLVSELNVECAYISEFIHNNTKAKTRSFCKRGTILEPIEYELKNTPCEILYENAYCHIESAAQQKFPHDDILAEFNIESFLGIQLISKSGEVLGVLGILHTQPISEIEISKSVLQIFGERVAIEIERINADEKLHASEERFRQLFESSHDGICLFDPNLKPLIWNRRLCYMLGYENDEFSSIENIGKIIHPDDVNQLHENNKKRVAGEPVENTYEFKLIHKNQSIVYVETSFDIVYSNAEIIGIQGMIRDITERKQIQRQLHFTQYAVEYSSDAIYWSNAQGQYIYANQSACKELGYTKEELLSLSVLDVATSLHEWDAHLERLKFSKSLTYETEHMRKDRSTYPVEITVNYLEYDNQEFVFALSRNITDRIQSQNKLKQNEEQFRAVVENSPDFYLFLDSEYKIHYINKLDQGYTYNEIIGKCALDFVLPEYYEPYKKTIDDTFLHQTLHQIEICSIDTHYFFNRIIPINLTNDQQMVLVIATETTEKRISDQALRENEERLSLAAQAANIATWEYNIVTDELIWDDKMYELYEQSRDSFGCTLQDWLALLNQEDKDIQQALYRASKKAGNKIYTHFCIELSKNRSRHIETHAMFIHDDTGSPVRLIGINRDITRKIKRELKLIETQKLLDEAERLVFVGGWVWDMKDNTFTFSKQWMQIHGSNKDKMNFDELLTFAYPEDIPAIQSAFKQALEEDGIYQIQHRIINQITQDTRWLHSHGEAEYDDKGQPIRMYGACLDITEKKFAEEEHKKLESHLNHAQRMESIGNLSGGIAHDFNNILMGIMGYSEMAMEELDEDHICHGYISQIYNAGKRGTDLTKKLLTFSRKQEIKPVMIDVKEKIQDIHESLMPLLGREIIVELIISPDVNPIKADPGQIDQILINLAVNARDAMPNGGRLTIEAKNMQIDESFYVDKINAEPGMYVLITVRDTGSGMDQETKDKIFEPFFTTKEQSKGTGLGLSTVYGIVKQNKGMITVYSEPGHGTVFHIYFPSAEKPEEIAINLSISHTTPSKHKNILILDDEQIVLHYIQNTLEQNGFSVYATTSPEHAEEQFQSELDNIELLITDVMLPNSSGIEIAHAFLKLKSDLKVLFISGYTDDDLNDFDFTGNQFKFLTKPFAINEFINTIHILLAE